MISCPTLGDLKFKKVIVFEDIQSVVASKKTEQVKARRKEQLQIEEDLGRMIAGSKLGAIK